MFSNANSNCLPSKDAKSHRNETSESKLKGTDDCILLSLDCEGACIGDVAEQKPLAPARDAMHALPRPPALSLP